MTRRARGILILMTLAAAAGGLGYGGVHLAREWGWIARPALNSGGSGARSTSGSGEQGAAAGPERVFPPFWTRAIAALGGQEKLAGIKRLRIHVQASEEGGPAHLATVSYEFPSAYRLDAEAMDAHLIQATDGTTCWSTFDGLEVPFDPRDRNLLAEQVFLARLSLLVGLDPKTEVDIDEQGLEKGLQAVKVRYLAGDLGPYLLGFDPKTALLKEAQWDTRILFHGLTRSDHVRLLLSDYQPVDGILVPFKAVYRIEGKARAESQVRTVEINPQFPAEFFSQPKAESEASIKERDLAAQFAVVLRRDQGRSPDFKKLDKVVAAAKLRRNGARFRVIEDGEIIAVGLGVAPPEENGSRDRPEFVTMQPRRALTTVIARDERKLWHEAQKRLRAHADAAGLQVEKSFRHVIWGSKGPVQIQLLVKN